MLYGELPWLKTRGGPEGLPDLNWSVNSAQKNSAESITHGTNKFKGGHSFNTLFVRLDRVGIVLEEVNAEPPLGEGWNELGRFPPATMKFTEKKATTSLLP